MKIGGQVRLLRTVHGWTQGELALKAGTKQSRISEIEKGRHNPTVTTLKKLAAAFGMKLYLGFEK